MAPHLIALCTLIYVCVAVSNLRAGDGPMALVFGAYALANIGLIWQALGGRPWSSLLPWL